MFVSQLFVGFPKLRVPVWESLSISKDFFNGGT